MLASSVISEQSQRVTPQSCALPATTASQQQSCQLDALMATITVAWALLI